MSSLYSKTGSYGDGFQEAASNLRTHFNKVSSEGTRAAVAINGERRNTAAEGARSDACVTLVRLLRARRVRCPGSTGIEAVSSPPPPACTVRRGRGRSCASATASSCCKPPSPPE
eukprot:475619-Prorocentrum_minimum.AAC.1